MGTMEKHRLCGWIRNNKMDILTEEYVKNMPASREMDKLIAERIMGLELWYGDPTGFDIPENIDYWRTDTKDWNDELYLRCPFYSDDIARAWEVLEKFYNNYSIILNYDDPLTIESMKWYCELYAKGKPFVDYEVYSPTAPLAICRVALLVTLIT
jgi:hypothetical protein